MKTKATKFKNPFDLMQDQQQQIIDVVHQVNSTPYVPKGKVHTPLPFDPYQNSNSTASTRQDKKNQSNISYSTIVKQNKKAAMKNKNGFTNPFGTQLQQQQELQQFSSKQYSSQQYPNKTPMSPMSPLGFNPSNTPQARNLSAQNISYTGQLNQDGDPPLLQGIFLIHNDIDIGIDIGLIKQRLLMTIKSQKPQYEQLQSTDLAGPIMIAMIFGCLLLLSGKIHFGDIYAMFLFGNSIMYFLVNFMNQSDVIPLYNVMSTLGYSLLPMLITGFFGIFFSLRGGVGITLTLSIAFWSSLSAGNTLEVYLRQPHNNRKYLVVYPLFLFYLCFGMIVIF